jgi:DNA-binding transcriptional LysR family regulator
MLDLGFSRPLPPERRRYFEEEVVYIDHLAAVLPPKHPLTKEKRIRLEKLASEPFVLVHRAGASGLFDEVVAMCRRAGFSPKVRTRARTPDNGFCAGGMRAWSLASTRLRARFRAAENRPPAIVGAIRSYRSMCYLASWISESDTRSFFGRLACPKASHPEMHSRFC